MEIYQGTTNFPKQEVYGLAQQMRRAAVSIPSNIAEGKGRNSDKDFRRFLFNARGSLMELETQILLAAKLQYLSEAQSRKLQSLATQVARGLAGLINALASVA
jgi:four helix bundle protein